MDNLRDEMVARHPHEREAIERLEEKDWPDAAYDQMVSVRLQDLRLVLPLARASLSAPRVQELVEALFDTRNALAIVGRPCRARTDAMEKADALLADYPPFVEMKGEMQAMLVEWREKGWLDDTALTPSKEG